MLEIADLVVSLNGRDKGNILMVNDIIDEDFVYIADGITRKLEHQKKKKQKHLRKVGIANDRTLEKVSEGKKLTNAELRKMIRKLESDR